jgi:hypothetical protein
MSATSALDYSSWSFQLIGVLVIIYLAVGLAKPAWVLATKRSTVAIISAAVLLIASTAFYFSARKLPGGDDTAAEIGAEPPPAPPAQQ